MFQMFRKSGSGSPNEDKNQKRSKSPKSPKSTTIKVLEAKRARSKSPKPLPTIKPSDENQHVSQFLLFWEPFLEKFEKISRIPQWRKAISACCCCLNSKGFKLIVNNQEIRNVCALDNLNYITDEGHLNYTVFFSFTKSIYTLSCGGIVGETGASGRDGCALITLLNNSTKIKTEMPVNVVELTDFQSFVIQFVEVCVKIHIIYSEKDEVFDEICEEARKL